jgi:predicted DNA-binding mobile mystery protein A
MKIPSRSLVALDEFDRHMPHLQLAAAAFRDQKPRGGWVRGIRSLLRMSMRDFAVRIKFGQSASVKELERNERMGTIKLITLIRAADALNADFVYAIIPRTPLREFVAVRAREILKERLGSGFHSAPQWQIDMLTGSIERKLKTLWHQ